MFELSLIVLLATAVRFNEGSYRINEDIGILQVLLVLSNPSSFNETVEIHNADFNFIGMYCKYVHT